MTLYKVKIDGFETPILLKDDVPVRFRSNKGITPLGQFLDDWSRCVTNHDFSAEIYWQNEWRKFSFVFHQTLDFVTNFQIKLDDSCRRLSDKELDEINTNLNLSIEDSLCKIFSKRNIVISRYHHLGPHTMQVELSCDASESEST